MKKTNWFLKHSITVFSCVAIIVLGITFLTYADSVTTTIGENIATNDLSVAGNITSGTWQGSEIQDAYIADGITASNYLPLTGGTLTSGLTVNGVTGLVEGDIPNLSASKITSGTLTHERGGLEADVSAYDGLLKISSGVASAITDSSTNWDTAYTYSQVGHLPLAGGTLTSGLTVDGVTGLVDADIPDTITVSNYLPLTGGTLTADLIIQETGDAKLTIYSNTDSPTADSKLFVVQKGATPSELFSVDEDGDVITAGDFTISGGELYLNGVASSSSTTEGTMYYDTDDDQLKVYANGKWQSDRSAATIIVGTSNPSGASLNYEKADYVCDGTDDDVQIQAAIDALPSGGGSVLLLEGIFVLDAPNDFYVSSSKYALYINSNNIELIGSRGTILKLKDGIDIGGGVASGFAVTIRIGSAAENILIKNIRFNNNYTNITADYNIAIWHDGTRVDVSYNYFENNKRWAIYGDGSGNFWNVHHNIFTPNGTGAIGFHNGPSHSQITNNIIANSSSVIGTGIFIDSVDHIQIIGNYIRRPNACGIQIYDDVNYCVISNNIIENYYDTSKGILMNTKGNDASSNNSNMIQGNSFVNMPNGIVLNDSYVKNTVVKNNQFVSVATPITDSGTDSVIQNNIGYITESSGTATLANTTTSIVVTHGLAVIPSAGDITVTPIEAWGAMTEFYIDTYTSTQFTIHADQDPGKDVDFAWKAIVL